MSKLTGWMIVLAALLPTVFSLRCYNCNSATDPSCLTQGNEASVVECPRFEVLGAVAEQACYKAEGEGNVKGVFGVSRGCTDLRENDKMETYCAALSDLSKSHGGEVTSCVTCSTDLCNSTSRLGVSLAVLLLGVFYRFVL